MRSKLSIAALLLLSTPVSAGPIDNIPVGHWYQVPNSHLRDAEKPPSAYADWDGSRSLTYERIGAVEGVSAVINDWSGGAFDSQRDRLIVWGGGHCGYAGNEIYVFDLNRANSSPGAPAWIRVNDPYETIDGMSMCNGSGGTSIQDSGYYPFPGQPTTPNPQAPRSRHSYEYLEYLPNIDRFCSVGSRASFPTNGAAYPSQKVQFDCFDFGTGLWERRADATAYGEASTAYDSSTGHLWAQGSMGSESGSTLSEYNPNTNTWTVHGSRVVLNDALTMEIDPTRGILLVIGSGDTANHVWYDIRQGGSLAANSLNTSGANGIEFARAPGLAYDPVADRFVAWDGGADVYVLDWDAQTWTRITPAAANTVTPTGAATQGTFGRFRYSPSKNVFVVVNSVDQDVYMYRLTLGSGSNPDTIPPAVPTGLVVLP